MGVDVSFAEVLALQTRTTAKSVPCKKKTATGARKLSISGLPRRIYSTNERSTDSKRDRNTLLIMPGTTQKLLFKIKPEHPGAMSLHATASSLDDCESVCGFKTGSSWTVHCNCVIGAINAAINVTDHSKLRSDQEKGNESGNERWQQVWRSSQTRGAIETQLDQINRIISQKKKKKKISPKKKKKKKKKKK